MHKNRVLVSGATGFAGSHILEALMSRDDVQPIAACRDPDRLVSGYGGAVRRGDLRDPARVRALVHDVDVVCNAAAWSSVWNHERVSRERFLEPAIRLIDAARAAGVRRFVQVSTTSAAAPEASHDPMSRGVPRVFWPHLSNLIAIENYLRDRATERFQVINLRVGLFAGARYGLGLLPILLPRLKTHLVPWVDGGRTEMPVVDGRDIGQAFALAVTTPGLSDYEAFNIVGPEVPMVREVIEFLHQETGCPTPHFSVPFPVAYRFAWLMEKLDRVVSWEPLVTRSIIHLLENVHADNRRAEALLGYRPRVSWREAVSRQLAEMQQSERRAMRMASP